MASTNGLSLSTGDEYMCDDSTFLYERPFGEVTLPSGGIGTGPELKDSTQDHVFYKTSK